MRKRDGATLSYSYDALSRMTLKMVPERAGLAAAQTRDVYYGYDLRESWSPLAASVDTTRFRYDGAGRMIGGGWACLA